LFSLLFYKSGNNYFIVGKVKIRINRIKPVTTESKKKWLSNFIQTWKQLS
jgi:hypothetical protein